MTIPTIESPDIIAAEGPPRDPQLSEILHRASRALSAITDPDAQLNVITTTARDLELIGDDGTDPIGHLSDLAQALGLDPDAVQEALARGGAEAWEARARAREEKEQRQEERHTAPPRKANGAWQDGGIGQDKDGTIRQSAATPFIFDPKPYQFPDPDKIPPRQWLYGRHYMRGVVSGTLGAPGRLKSTTLLTELVGMAAGRDLIGGKLLECGPLRAGYFNGEETQDELDRRVAAIRQRYHLDPEDCAGRLWVVSTREAPLRLAVMGPKGTAEVAHDVVDAITAWCETRSIDAFVVDPLVSFHLVRENDPGDMDMLYKEAFGRIAGKERRAVDLAIHPRKPAQGEVNTSMSDLRGSGAQEAALRIARVFNFMTTTEAGHLGIDEEDRRLHVRIEGGKGGPGPIAKATWIKIDVEPLPNGDDVAVAVAWKPENPFTKVVQGDLQVVQRVVQGGAFRTSSQSPDWLGWWMAENLPHLGIKTRFHDKPRTAAGKAEVARLNEIIATWKKNEGIDIEKREDKNRQPRDFFIVGRQSSEPAENHADADCTTLMN